MSSASTTSRPRGPGELGEFLRSRRDAFRPEDAGVVGYGLRRVPGLRREELAQLAGVSVAYYTRLEQGLSLTASDGVLDALARALQLRDDERSHLLALARPQAGRRRRAPRPEQPTPGGLALLDAMPGVPAVILGRRSDVLAWNPLGHALFAGHLDIASPADPATRPNLTRMMFLDPHTRDLYRNWDAEAVLVVSSLRFVAAQHPDDRALAELVGELSMRSATFATLWSRHTVELCSRGVKQLHHPEIGDLDTHYQALHLPEADGQRLLTHTVAPGSSSADALRLLQESILAPSVPRQPRHAAGLASN